MTNFILLFFVGRYGGTVRYRYAAGLACLSSPLLILSSHARLALLLLSEGIIAAELAPQFTLPDSHVCFVIVVTKTIVISLLVESTTSQNLKNKQKTKKNRVGNSD